jgi:hypothetical protein
MIADLPGWPWGEVPKGARRLDWSARLQSDPAAAYCDIRYAVVTQEKLIFLVDVVTPEEIDFVEEERPPAPKRAEDPRFWVTVGGVEVESIGEWDGSDLERLRQLDHPEVSLHDWVSHLGDRAAAVTMSPVPRGKIRFSVQWLARGLERCGVDFDMADG